MASLPVWGQRYENWEQSHWSKFWSSETQHPEASLFVGRKNEHFSSTRGRICPSFTFCSIQDPNRLDDPCSHQGGKMSLLNILNRICSSLPETPSGTRRSNILPAVWACFTRVKLTHKTDHHGAGQRMRKQSDTHFAIKNLHQEITWA